MNRPKRALRHQAMRWSWVFIDSRHQAICGLSGAGMKDAGEVGVAGAVGAAGGVFSSTATASPLTRPIPTAAATAVATAHCERTGSSAEVDSAAGVAALAPTA